jgi:hypothetical protein
MTYQIKTIPKVKHRITAAECMLSGSFASRAW